MPTSIAQIRNQWRRNPRSERQWSRVEDQSGNDQGECKGEFVESPGFSYIAYLKPGKIGQAAWPWPLPAYEKIAADFAHDLKCPVPAVQIFERRDNIPDGYASYCCVSLKEFEQRFPWSTCASAFSGDNSSPVVKQLIRGALSNASGMVVLDTWLGQGDRGEHPANVQLSYDPTRPARTRFTYLDFGRTLNWNGAWNDDGWKKIIVTAQPRLVMENLDKSVVRDTYERLMDLSESDVQSVICRLIGEYFLESAASQLAEQLCKRRELLKGVLNPYIEP